jgi:COPII coat assembly protein SEC16
MSNASSIDDLMSLGPRKAGGKKAKKPGRGYVDVLGK